MIRPAEQKREAFAFLLGIAAVAPVGCASPSHGCAPAAPGLVEPVGNGLNGSECLTSPEVYEALTGLARRFEIGDGVPIDLRRAAALYRRAAREPAEYGLIYAAPVRRGGSGRVMNVGRPGSRRGWADAQFRLGLMYLEGRGVHRDQAAASRLLRAAAAQGHAAAKAALTKLVDR